MAQGTVADPVGPILGVQAYEAEFVEAREVDVKGRPVR
jgi:hypothetical protein